LSRHLRRRGLTRQKSKEVLVKATLLTLTVALAAALLTLVPGTAEAAFPGKNGRIVFFSNIHNKGDIYSINPDGSGGPTQLTNHPEMDFDPAVSPDGTKIAFASYRSGSSHIYVMGADGSNPKQLTFTGKWEGDPAWSPDGSKIAFARAHGANWDHDIFVMNADGSSQTQLTIWNGADWNTDPAWSPDGKKLAVATRWGIEVLEVNQAGPIVADPPGYFVTYFVGDTEGRHYESPTWSPDGSLIVFEHTRDGFYSDLYGVEAALSGDPLNPNPAVNMTLTPWTRETDPAWSPDGKRLVYSAAHTTGFGHTDFDLYVMDWGAWSIPYATQLIALPFVGEYSADWSSMSAGPR
jgi:Tol biopolymer transport system component